jgi:hypothetical protein
MEIIMSQVDLLMSLKLSPSQTNVMQMDELDFFIEAYHERAKEIKAKRENGINR